MYLQVYDLDVSGSVDVLVTGDTDTGGETVTLTEVSTGLFQGTLSVNLSSFKIIDNKDQYAIDVETRMRSLSMKHSDWDEDRLKSRASAEVYNEYFERARKGDIRSKSINMSLEDGVLQVSTGDLMVMTYEDATNDYGNAETITDEAVYGGWSGNVSGTWTAANSPYVVTGDIYVNESDSLIIEPGVEVKFLSNYVFDVRGYFYAVGTETDSIKFIPVNMTNPVQGMWGGLHFIHHGDASQVTLSYFVVAYGGNWDWPYGGLVFYNRYYSEGTVISHGDIYGSSAYGAYIYSNYGSSDNLSQVTFQNVKIHNNSGDGLQILYNYYCDIDIDGCEIYDNSGNGIYVYGNYDATVVDVTGSDIHDNGGSEVYVGYFEHQDGVSYTFNNNNIMNDDYNWLVYTDCCWSEQAGVEVDFRYNFWGESTTAEMNEGDNPKNISLIYDWWDDNQRSVINYAGWLQAPYLAPQISYYPVEYNTIVVEGDTTSFILAIKNTGEGDLTFSLSAASAKSTSNNKFCTAENSVYSDNVDMHGEKDNGKMKRSLPFKKDFSSSSTESINSSMVTSSNWITFSQNTGTIIPGDSLNIRVTLDAGSLTEAVYAANININSNDPMNSDVLIPVSLEVIAEPVLISVSATELNFGYVSLGSSAEASLWIKNTGNIELVISNIIVSNNMFSVSDTSFSIATGDSYSVSIAFNPNVEGEFIDYADILGEFKEKLTILSNATFDPELNIDLAGIITLPSIEAPEITSIKDVPNDQGRHAILSWKASANDGNIYNPVYFYSIWIKFTGSTKSLSDVVKFTNVREMYDYYQNQNSNGSIEAENLKVISNSTAYHTDSWIGLGTIGAIQDSVYSFLSSTLIDSNYTGINWSYFKISAHGANPFGYAFSDVDSGYSIDNIAPGIVTNLTATIIPSESSEFCMVLLEWDGVKDSDLWTYMVFRDTESGFVPENFNDTLATSDSTNFIDEFLSTDTIFYYKVTAVDINGNWGVFSDEISVTYTQVSEYLNVLPVEFALSRNFPNPFNPTTKIKYALPTNCNVSLIIYNLLGKEVRTLVNGNKSSGYYDVIWDGRNNAGIQVTSGIYIYHLIAKNEDSQFSQVKKMILTK